MQRLLPLLATLVAGCPPIGTDTDARLSSCDDPALVSAMADLVSPDRTVSCARAILAAGPSDQKTRLKIRWAMDWNAPLDNGDRFALDLDDTTDLGAEVVGGTATLTIGQRLLQDECDDALEIPGPKEERTWSVVSGDLWLEVTRVDTPQPWGTLFDANVTMSGAAVEADDGSRCPLPDVSWAARAFGWLAG